MCESIAQRIAALSPLSRPQRRRPDGAEFTCQRAACDSMAYALHAARECGSLSIILRLRCTGNSRRGCGDEGVIRPKSEGPITSRCRTAAPHMACRYLGAEGARGVMVASHPNPPFSECPNRRTRAAACQPPVGAILAPACVLRSFLTYDDVELSGAGSGRASGHPLGSRTGH